MQSDDNWALKDTVLQTLVAATVRMRLIRQFTPVFLEILLSWLSPATAEIMDEVLTALHGSSVPSADRQLFERHLWKTVFADLAAGDVSTVKSLVAESWNAPSCHGD